jgi:hypothetical protein
VEYLFDIKEEEGGPWELFLWKNRFISLFYLLEVEDGLPLGVRLIT